MTDYSVGDLIFQGENFGLITEIDKVHVMIKWYYVKTKRWSPYAGAYTERTMHAFNRGGYEYYKQDKKKLR